ncbi:hypothetical protein SAMN05216404_1116 [Nitrosospira multiformis]|uniref:Pyridine nucleotide-disulphide oxidoreductase dimerisation domain-containing protein n=2 Tax=Nitrosospira multiformis TaxID=1231 RepID=A0A1H8LQW6_9PROT|nr:hypothetical protein [Nitrosospira multiformis]SEO07248.1 hypothetical protein SAMN05216404_1116 [Nitrosospira multiformis]
MIVSGRAGDLLAEFVLAMKQWSGFNRILGTIHTYPTWPEAGKHAASEWRRPHLPFHLLYRVEKYHTWGRLKDGKGSRQGPEKTLAAIEIALPMASFERI